MLHTAAESAASLALCLLGMIVGFPDNYVNSEIDF